MGGYYIFSDHTVPDVSCSFRPPSPPFASTWRGEHCERQVVNEWFIRKTPLIVMHSLFKRFFIKDADVFPRFTNCNAGPF